MDNILIKKFMSQFFDITTPLNSSLIAWPGESGFSRTPDLGEEAEVSRLEMGSHTGTHIDAPKHFIRGGDSIDNLFLDSLIGKCVVVELEYSGNLISKEDIDKIPKGFERVIFKTENSRKNLLTKNEFETNFVSLSLEAAEELVKRNFKLVGVDYLSVEAKGSPGHPVHNTLLKNNIVSLEGCNLVDIVSGEYKIYALPLRIEGGDGSPARVVLEKL